MAEPCFAPPPSTPGRAARRVGAVGLGVLLGLFAARSAQAGELFRMEDHLDAMGSLYTIAAFGEDPAHLRHTIDAGFEEIRRIDRLISNYRRDSEWSGINRRAATEPVRVSTEVYRLLDACLAYSEASQGAFDITVGPLMKVWGFYRGTGRLPKPEEIAAAAETVGYRYIQLDPAARTVRFTRPGVEIDPGGIGKGYAVDRVADLFREQEIVAAMISAAGSSMYAIGAPPGEPRGWRVSIRHPKDPDQTVETVFLKDQSMSTSGSYEKFFIADGRLYSHIMDPRTGYPAQGVLSVSVVAPRTLDSEAWTKPYFILGRTWAEQYKPDSFRVFLCEERSELSCAWLP